MGLQVYEDEVCSRKTCCMCGRESASGVHYCRETTRVDAKSESERSDRGCCGHWRACMYQTPLYFQ